MIALRNFGFELQPAVLRNSGQQLPDFDELPFTDSYVFDKATDRRPYARTFRCSLVRYGLLRRFSVLVIEFGLFVFGLRNNFVFDELLRPLVSCFCLCEGGPGAGRVVAFGDILRRNIEKIFASAYRSAFGQFFRRERYDSADGGDYGRFVSLCG